MRRAGLPPPRGRCPSQSQKPKQAADQRGYQPLDSDRKIHLEMRDDFNLHTRTLRQRGDLDRGARRKIFSEILRVNFIHAGEIREIRQEHRAFDDVGERQHLVFQNRLHILQHAVGLRLDVAGNQISIRRFNRDLSCTKKQIADAHGMIVRADGGG